MIPKYGTNTQSFSKKRRKKKFNKVFILLIVLVYIVSRTTPILTENAKDFHTITYGTLEDSISFKGVILRDETVLTGNTRNVLVESGERVANGQGITEGLQSPSPGVIVLNKDGYEEQLNFCEILQNPEKRLEILENLADNEHIEEVDGIRLVKGYHWGVVGKIPRAEAKELQIGQSIHIESEEQRVRGEVAWAQEIEDADSSLVMVRSKEFLEGIYKNRKMDLTLIKREVEGLVVPVDTVYYKDGDPYVTKRQLEKSSEVPVNIILKDEQRAILSSEEFTDSDGTTSQTVSLYDKILLDPGKEQGEDN